MKVKQLGDGAGGEVCGACRRPVGEKQRGLQCDGCDAWYHDICEKVTEEEYKYLSIVKEIMWFCRKCKENYKQLREENKTLKDENKSLRQENEILKKRLMKLEARVENLEKGVKGSNNQEMMQQSLQEIRGELRECMKQTFVEMRNSIIQEICEKDMQEVRKSEERIETIEANLRVSIVKEVKEKVLEEFKEEEDKKKRQQNLIVYSLEESEKEQGMEREQDDRTKLVTIIENELGVTNVTIEKVIRLGRQSENSGERQEHQKPRPLLVKLQTTMQKWQILKRAKFLRNATVWQFRKVRLAPDLTIKEREVDKQLREELKAKRENGEEGWFISGGQLKKRNFQERVGRR